MSKSNFIEYLTEVDLDKPQYGHVPLFTKKRAQYVARQLMDVASDYLDAHQQQLGKQSFDVRIKFDEFGDPDPMDDDDYDQFHDDDYDDDDPFHDNWYGGHDTGDIERTFQKRAHDQVVDKVLNQVLQHGEHFLAQRNWDNKREFTTEHGRGNRRSKDDHLLMAYALTLSQMPHQESDPDVALPSSMINEIMNDLKDEVQHLLQQHVHDITITVTRGEGKRPTHVTVHDQRVHESPYVHYTFIVTFEWYHGPLLQQKKERGKKLQTPSYEDAILVAKHHILSVTKDPENFIPEVLAYLEQQE